MTIAVAPHSNLFAPSSTHIASSTATTVTSRVAARGATAYDAVEDVVLGVHDEPGIDRGGNIQDSEGEAHGRGGSK